MEIHINSQPLAFTLENENTLGDVIKAIETWLERSNLIITSAILKEQELFSQPAEEWMNLALSEVDTLHVTVKHAREVRINNLQTVLEYLSMLKQALENQNRKLLEELIEGFPYLMQSFQKQFKDELKQDLLKLTALFSSTSADAILSWSEEIYEGAGRLICKLEASVNLRLKELHNPKEALKELLEELEPCIEEISEVSVLLQTGRDRQAMESIIRFSELSQSLINIIAGLREALPSKDRHLLIAGKDFEEFYLELNNVLKELIEAFKAQDSVLIGDLMEYEIAPRLEGLKDFAMEIT